MLPWTPRSKGSDPPGPAVEDDARGAATVGQYLDVPPRDAPPARPQCLHHRFLAREPHRQLRNAAAAEIDLGLRVYAPEEPLAPAVDDLLDAAYLYYVNSSAKHALSPGTGPDSA